MRPRWLKFILIGAGTLGTLLIILGVIRILFLGGVLIVAGRSIFKKETPPPPPPPSPV